MKLRPHRWHGPKPEDFSAGTGEPPVKEFVVEHEIFERLPLSVRDFIRDHKVHLLDLSRVAHTIKAAFPQDPDEHVVLETAKLLWDFHLKKFSASSPQDFIPHYRRPQP